MTATLRFDVVANGSVARRELASTRGEVERFGKSTTVAGGQAEKSRGKLARFGGAVGGVAKRFGPLAIAAAGAGLIKFGADAVKAASDTQQAFGAIGSVFGKNAAQVKAWANSAAKDVGLTRSEYAEMATVLGAGLKNAGVDEFATKTNNLVKIGADLAATFGGSTSEAVSALGSLMRGEADPIERFGVTIKQSDVNARLAAQGQAKLTGAARRTAEMQARLDLVTKQTASSTGAFKRESNTLAGAQQRLKAQFGNAKDTLGRALIPALTKGTSALVGALSGSSGFGKGLRALGGIIKSYATPVIRGVRDAISSVRDAFAKADKSGGGLKKAFDFIKSAARTLAPIVGQTLGTAIRTLGVVIGGAVTVADKLLGALSAVVSWASRARDAIGKLGGGAIGKIAGVLSRGAPGSESMALTRAAGGGLVGGGAYSPSVSLTSSPRVYVQIDSAAMARLFRVIVRDELAQASRSTGGGVLV